MGGAAAHPRGSGVETARDFENFLELSSRFLIGRIHSDTGAYNTTGGRDNTSLRRNDLSAEICLRLL